MSLSQYLPLWVNIFLPSNTLGRSSRRGQNGRQNSTERKSSKHICHALLISQLKTNNVSRSKTAPMNSGTEKTQQRHITRHNPRLFRSISSPHQTVECDKSESSDTPDALITVGELRSGVTGFPTIYMYATDSHRRLVQAYAENLPHKNKYSNLANKRVESTNFRYP